MIVLLPTGSLKSVDEELSKGGTGLNETSQAVSIQHEQQFKVNQAVPLMQSGRQPLCLMSAGLSATVLSRCTPVNRNPAPAQTIGQGPFSHMQEF
jgi:hypothetical protein